MAGPLNYQNGGSLELSKWRQKKVSDKLNKMMSNLKLQLESSLWLEVLS